MWRIVRVLMVGLAGAIGLIVLSLLPDLIGFLPLAMRDHWALSLALAFAIAHAIVRRLAATDSEQSIFARWARAGLVRVDRCTDWALRGGLKIALSLLCLGLLLGWIPHYLTWPWSRDPETFAVLAQSWDAGILPYRDIRAYNFPGSIYLAWALGKIFGWGHTAPRFAFDAGCVVLLGLILVAWSRRRLGDAVPGLVGYFAFLVFYLDLPYDLVTQRDWHTALLLCLGLFLMQAWPGRLTRFASAVAAALALALRPHAVLFLPALLWEVAQGVDDASPSGPARKIRAVALWCFWFAVFASLAFAPLVLAGIADDFLVGLRVATYGGPYSQITPASAIRVFADQFKSWKTDVLLAATWLLAASPRSRLNRIAKTWSLVWLGVLFYEPIHPVNHMDLRLPILLVSSIMWAIPVSWLLSSRRIARPAVAVAIALLPCELMPRPPWMCNFVATIEALGPVSRGDMPTTGPVGSFRPFPRNPGIWDRWNNYRALLLYIRNQTGPDTLVANALSEYPFESINGPTGRLSPFLAESGICWMTSVRLDLDSEFADALIRSPDSVVVWDPSRIEGVGALPLHRLAAAIRQNYEPAVRFGDYQVWTRKSATREAPDHDQTPRANMRSGSPPRPPLFKMTGFGQSRTRTTGIMRIQQLAQLLWFNVWWKYPHPGDPWFSAPYHFFNLFEGLCWAILACLVLRRYLVHRRSLIELAYSAAFLAFGVTDFREAYELASWLVWVKLFNLIVLFLLRRIVMKRCYPTSKLF